MSKSAFDKIAAGLNEMVAISKGEAEPARVIVPPRVDVRAVRARTGLTQAKFAQQFGFSVATLRDWEQGRYAPEPTARVLLTVIEREPEAVSRALAVMS